MTRYSGEHPMVLEAMELVDTLEALEDRDAKRCIIAEVLVHLDESSVRSLLLLISSIWHRYRVTIELYAAYGRKDDRARVLALITNIVETGESDGDDERDQLARVDNNLADGNFSRPERWLLDEGRRTFLMYRSSKRLPKFAHGPHIGLFNEYCLRIRYGDSDAVAKAMKLAGDDSSDRDRITMLIGMSHAEMGKVQIARHHLKMVRLPEHRIDLLLVLFLVEREMSPDVLQEALP